ncbi:hypothetical protein [Iodidimonas sp. SYSU 1G8]|uniref:hypothetical protein n=1 Tax=Iodidimonas sp. SYSU 1G8 TaxID=3133967 RepID=UPI0031FF45F6
MVEAHNSIIARAAKAALAPLGFRRKGQSRIWLADHGHWLGVVEFQPSGSSKGSYLNVYAHWLWTPASTGSTFTLSYDVGGRIDSSIVFQSEQQFAVEAASLAERAAQEAVRLRTKFHSIESMADVLLAQERAFAEEGRGGRWQACHAGVACVLAGRIDEARTILATVSHGSGPQPLIHARAKALMAGLADPDRLRRELLSAINRRRAAFKYPPLDELPVPVG